MEELKKFRGCNNYNISTRFSLDRVRRKISYKIDDENYETLKSIISKYRFDNKNTIENLRLDKYLQNKKKDRSGIYHLKEIVKFLNHCLRHFDVTDEHESDYYLIIKDLIFIVNWNLKSY